MYVFLFLNQYNYTHNQIERALKVGTVLLKMKYQIYYPLFVQFWTQRLLEDWPYVAVGVAVHVLTQDRFAWKSP